MRLTKTILMFIAIPLSLLLTGGKGLAWEAKITIRAGEIETKLIFGQEPDASSGMDGRYDVPALLSGELQAYFEAGGQRLWRDIRGTGVGEWAMVIESSRTGEIVLLWESEKLPDREVLLIDGGLSINMKEISRYSYTNDGKRILKIRVEGGR